MPWTSYFGHFVGAAFLANALPHLIAGVSGQPFHSPFASPPFRGLSSPAVNISWALFNLALAYVLLVQVGELDMHSWRDVAVCFVGFGIMALQGSRSLARIRKNNVL
jgi:hypothetical protein